jgi:hypothetical protein
MNVLSASELTSNRSPQAGMPIAIFASGQAIGGEVRRNEVRMFLEPIQCGAELGDGRKCEEIAKVIDAGFVYRKEFEGGRFEQVLDEVHYTMECPKCGRWKRVATAHSCCKTSTALL